MRFSKFDNNGLSTGGDIEVACNTFFEDSLNELIKLDLWP